MNLPIENLSPLARIAQIYCPYIYEQLINQETLIIKENNKSKYVFTKLNISLFCLSISFLIIVMLYITSSFLLYLTSIRTRIGTMHYKFNMSTS